MAKRRQLITSDEAVPSDKQHRKPCSDCPWARTALSGWLGSHTAEEWLRIAHSDLEIECHTVRSTSSELAGPQCAGAAIYRGNMCKSPRDPEILVLPADRERVFATPMEFKEHHEGSRS